MGFRLVSDCVRVRGGVDVVDDKHMARVLIAQSRATQHRQWKITLLNWACDYTRQAMRKPAQPQQLELI